MHSRSGSGNDRCESKTETRIVVMDMIKTEPEVDPLAIQTSDNTDLEEKKPFSEEVNLLNLQSTEMKKEYVDHSYDLTSNTRVPINFAFVNCEPEEESCDLNTVQEELKIEVTAEQDEVLTERFL
ncbi:uncharacterized protein [Periplaneta americana]|uniref:uncharacterized protein isoform X2 n=1 Tax=Periplaneta americana TaxID=6978 RepID=UPI0037E834A6